MHLFHFIREKTEENLIKMNDLYKRIKNAWIFRFLLSDQENGTSAYQLDIEAFEKELTTATVLFTDLRKLKTKCFDD